MNRVVQISISLYEAKKSYKNHIRKSLREKIDRIVESTLFFHMKKIKTTDQLIEYIEDEFRERNPQILLKYVEWVLKVFSLGTVSSIDIAIRINVTSKLLLRYDRSFRHGYAEDLKHQRIKSLKEFRTFVDGLYDPKDDEEYYKRNEADKIYEDKKIKLVNVWSYKACAYFSSGSRGRSTPWCIVNKDEWEEYRSHDWYILLIKGTNEKYAIDRNSGRAYDGQNQPTTFENIANNYPIIRNFIELIWPDSLKQVSNELKKYLEKEFNVDEIEIEIGNTSTNNIEFSVSIISESEKLVSLHDKRHDIQYELEQIAADYDLSLIYFYVNLNDVSADIFAQFESDNYGY